MKTGHEWTATIGPNLATRQDPYRVVLYYILILKNRAVIRTNEHEINGVTSNGEVKHEVTVKTAATVEEREPTEVQEVSPDDAAEIEHDAEEIDSDNGETALNDSGD